MSSLSNSRCNRFAFRLRCCSGRRLWQQLDCLKHSSSRSDFGAFDQLRFKQADEAFARPARILWILGSSHERTSPACVKSELTPFLLTASRASQNQIRQRFKNSSPNND